METTNIILTAVSTGLAVVVAIVGAVAWLLRKYANWEVERTQTKNRVDTLEEKAAALPCREHEKDMQSLRDELRLAVRDAVGVLPCREHEKDMQALRDELRQTVKDAVGVLPCREHEKNIEEHRRDIHELKQLTRENNGILTELSRWVMKTDTAMIDALARKSSPLRMTPAGRKLFMQSHAKEALDGMKSDLFARMEEVAPRTEYDADQAALDALLKSLHREEFDPVKRFVYHAPDRIKTDTGGTVRFDLFAIVRLMAIELRDQYLAKHPEARDVPDVNDNL